MGIVAARGGDNGTHVAQHLHNSIFDDSLAVASGDAHYGYMELAAMPSGQLLQGQNHIFDIPEVGLAATLELLYIFFRCIVGDDEVAAAPLVDVLNETATRVALGGDSEEERARHVGDMAAVG